MDELLESLTKKATVECEEAHRLLVAAFNGLAGWHIIKEQVICHSCYLIGDTIMDSDWLNSTVECEEAHRLLVSAYNGLAGWHIIEE